MGATKAKFEADLEAAKAHLNAAIAKLKDLGHTGAAKVEQVVKELEDDAPTLEREAERDAEHVAQTAAAQGIKPAEAEAVADAEELAAQAGHDVVTAVEDAAHTPAGGAAAEPTA